MRRLLAFLSSLIALTVTLALTGCTTQRPASVSQPSLLVMLRIPGGATPPPTVVARFHQSLAEPMTRAGLRFAQNMDEANYILSATFTPDPTNAEEGQFTIHQIKRNWSASSPPNFDQMRTQITDLQRWADSKAAPIQN